MKCPKCKDELNKEEQEKGICSDCGGEAHSFYDKR